ncbi:SH3 domain-containing protein [Maribacter sedimenticola]|uniref:SH3 domain-containing protein n=1 Tax=Maribacter sedimenticola TaxID=228956 RepID=A0ABY1SJ33_9FLAO|nr:C40 family peptidase [Maribacter sedimenticola]SNR60888.1 SH3 domain-containing protein [Maribacter sedimenticola]
MKKIQFLKAFILILITVQMSCNTGNEKEMIEQEIAVLKKYAAPDKRTALFDIDVLEGSQTIVLKGESNQPQAIDSLRSILQSKGIDFKDEIIRLPSIDLEGYNHAVVNISAANLRSSPKHSAELATQAIMGTTVKVLKKEGSWYLVQTPDQYLAWVDAGGIVLLNETDLTQWTNSNKIIVTNTYAHAIDTVNGTNRISDLVAGSLLKLLEMDSGNYKVQFPDGRTAFVPMTQAQEYNVWLRNLNVGEEALVETSKTLMGVPYLWGGTSTKGVDCSGFTKTIYFLNGMVIPRDASQQVHTGSSVDSLANFNALRKGDLLFFGKKATDSTAEKVVHVGMWIGDQQFIHSSDMVRVSSVDENAQNYDAYNVGRYLRSKRLLKEKDPLIMNLKEFKD